MIAGHTSRPAFRAAEGDGRRNTAGQGRFSGQGLAATLLLAIIALSGLVFIAAPHEVRPSLPNLLQPMEPARPGLGQPDLASLPGFQRRGNTVIGDVKDRDGNAVRMVFDARTQALIGLRQLAPGARPAQKSAPLSERQRPAN